MRLIKRIVFLSLVRGPFLAWVVFNGGMFMSDPEARLFKIAFTLVAAMIAAAILLEWFL